MGDSFLLFLKRMNELISGCAGSSLLHRLFSSCGEQGLLSVAVGRRLLIGVASLVVEHRL